MNNKKIICSILSLSFIGLIMTTIIVIKPNYTKTINNEALTKNDVNEKECTDITDFYNNVETVVPVIRLDKNIKLEDLKNENTVIVTKMEIINKKAYEKFIKNVVLKKNAFLRLVDITIEGDIIISDIKYDSKSSKTYVLRDSTRDDYGKKIITIDKYNYIEEIKSNIKGKSTKSLIVYQENKLDDNYLTLLTLDTFID